MPRARVAVITSTANSNPIQFRKESWPRRAGGLFIVDAKTKPLLLGGDWRETAQTREVRSPYNSELLAHFSVASRGDVEEAIDAAARAAAEMRELPRHRLAES